MISSSTCQPPLQLIEVKGELATSSLKVALNQKGLRQPGVSVPHVLFVFESSPEPEGIKTY